MVGLALLVGAGVSWAEPKIAKRRAKPCWPKSERSEPREIAKRRAKPCWPKSERSEPREIAFRDVSPVLPPQPPRLRPLSSGPTVIYLATDGITIQKGPTSDAIQDQSPICGAAVPPFEHSIFGSDRAAIVDELAGHVSRIFAPFNIRVVTTRPTQGPYDLVALGGLAGLCGLASGFAGYSPLDCGDASPQDVCFVFSEGITYLPMLAVIIAHEVGHAHGLPHTTEPCDVMSNLLCVPEDKHFVDASLTIAPDHQGRCGLGTQANSYQLLLAAVGARLGADGGADQTAADAGPPDGSPEAGARDGAIADGSGDLGKTTPPSDGCAVGSGRVFAPNTSSGLLLWPLALLLSMAFRRRRAREKGVLR